MRQQRPGARAPNTTPGQSATTDGPGRPVAAEPVAAASTTALLAEIGRRLALRFGRLEVVYHDGEPSPRIVVEHRVRRELDP